MMGGMRKPATSTNFLGRSRAQLAAIRPRVTRSDRAINSQPMTRRQLRRLPPAQASAILARVHVQQTLRHHRQPTGLTVAECVLP